MFPAGGSVASRASSVATVPTAANAKAANASLIVMKLSPDWRRRAHRNRSQRVLISSVRATTKDERHH
jgi:hypothetical protein